MSETTFFDWLMQQTKRDDAVGNFASDTRYKKDIELLPKSLQKDSSEEDWMDYFRESDKIIVGKKTVEAMREAWDEYTSNDPYKNTPNVNEQSSLGF